jgi:hypothetical protein
MVERLVTQFRALLGGRGAHAPVDDDLDDLEDELAGLPGPDPEWDELLAWAREADDEVEWTAVIARAKETAVVATDEAESHRKTGTGGRPAQKEIQNSRSETLTPFLTPAFPSFPPSCDLSANDDGEWTALIARAKQTAVAVAADEAEAETNDEAAEWRRLLALAKSNPATSVRPTPAPLPAVALRLTPAAMPPARPPVGSIASLSARLERLAAQVPDARRRRAR